MWMSNPPSATLTARLFFQLAPPLFVCPCVGKEKEKAKRKGQKKKREREKKRGTAAADWSTGRLCRETGHQKRSLEGAGLVATAPFSSIRGRDGVETGSPALAYSSRGPGLFGLGRGRTPPPADG